MNTFCCIPYYSAERMASVVLSVCNYWGKVLLTLNVTN
ncbi:Uncharacterised protein [uncultured Bacteroides sp.]|nr:Uncharacterised protein [uncultured Bacteroides sp.]